MKSRGQRFFNFLIVFAVGFGIAWFFFRHREKKTKIMVGVIGGLALPILLYYFTPSFGDSVRVTSFNDLLSSYGFTK